MPANTPDSTSSLSESLELRESLQNMQLSLLNGFQPISQAEKEIYNAITAIVYLNKKDELIDLEKSKRAGLIKEEASQRVQQLEGRGAIVTQKEERGKGAGLIKEEESKGTGLKDQSSPQKPHSQDVCSNKHDLTSGTSRQLCKVNFIDEKTKGAYSQKSELPPYNAKFSCKNEPESNSSRDSLANYYALYANSFKEAATKATLSAEHYNAKYSFDSSHAHSTLFGEHCYSQIKKTPEPYVNQDEVTSSSPAASVTHCFIGETTKWCY